jgi:phosphomannomutase
MILHKMAATAALPFVAASGWAGYAYTQPDQNQYNGVKIVAKNAHSVCGKELQEILSMIQSGNFIDNKGQKGTLSKQSITDEYIKDLCARASLGRSMKVVVDAGNGKILSSRDRRHF